MLDSTSASSAIDKPLSVEESHAPNPSASSGVLFHRLDSWSLRMSNRTLSSQGGEARALDVERSLNTLLPVAGADNRNSHSALDAPPRRSGREPSSLE